MKKLYYFLSAISFFILFSILCIFPVSASYPASFSANFAQSLYSSFGTFSFDGNSFSSANCTQTENTLQRNNGFFTLQSNSTFSSRPGYSYKRLKSPLNYNRSLGAANGAVTIDLSLNLIGLPDLDNDYDAKVGQTGFIVNIRMAKTNKEFYFCFAQYYDEERGTNAIISSYTGARSPLSSQNLHKAYVTLDLQQEAEFHKYTFRYDPSKAQNERITLYVDGRQLATFPEPTYRTDDPPYDFVYFTLSPRLFSEPEYPSTLSTYGRIYLEYIHIYNTADAAYTGTSLNVPLHGQHENNTCSIATQRMILEYYGVVETEEVIYENAKELANLRLNDRNAFNSNEGFLLSLKYWLPSTAPDYVEQETYGLMPSPPPLNSDANDYRYLQKVTESIDRGDPVALLMKTQTGEESSAWGYSTGGHWVVICGYSYDATQGRYLFEICDPADGTARWIEASGRKVNIPYSVVRRVNYRHSGLLFGNF